MSEAKKYLKRVGLIQSPYISQERVVKHLEAFAKEQVEAITVTHCCKPKGTVKTIDFDKAKNFMINYMNIDDDTKHVVSMAHYSKTVTVKEFFEIMQNAFEKALK